MKRRTIFAFAGLPLLGACGSTQAGSPQPAATVTVTQTQTVTTEPSATGPVEGEPSTNPSSADTILKFGDTIKGDSGREITVGAPVVFKPSYTDENDKVDEYVYLPITFVNGSDEVTPASSFGFRATTGDREAPIASDLDQGVDPIPTSDVLPGKTLKWKVGFGRDKGKDFVVSVDYIIGTIGRYQ